MNSNMSCDGSSPLVSRLVGRYITDIDTVQGEGGYVGIMENLISQTCQSFPFSLERRSRHLVNLPSACLQPSVGLLCLFLLVDAFDSITIRMGGTVECRVSSLRVGPCLPDS